MDESEREEKRNMLGLGKLVPKGVDIAKFSLRKKYALFMLFCVYIITCVGIFFNWISLSDFFYHGNVYIDDCKNVNLEEILYEEGKSYSCAEQDKRVQALYPIILCSNFIMSAISGVSFDYFGPKITALIGHTFNIISWVLIGLQKDGTNNTIIWGAIFLGLSGDSSYIPILSLIYLFEKNHTMYTVIFGCCASLSFSIPIFLDIFTKKNDTKSFQLTCMSYCTIILIPFFFVLLIFLPFNHISSDKSTPVEFESSNQTLQELKGYIVSGAESHDSDETHLGRPIGESIDEPVGEAIDEPIGELIDEPVGELIDEPVGEAINEPTIERKGENDPLRYYTNEVNELNLQSEGNSKKKKDFENIVPFPLCREEADTSEKDSNTLRELMIERDFSSSSFSISPANGCVLRKVCSQHTCSNLPPRDKGWGVSLFSKKGIFSLDSEDYARSSSVRGGGGEARAGAAAVTAAGRRGTPTERGSLKINTFEQDDDIINLDLFSKEKKKHVFYNETIETFFSIKYLSICYYFTIYNLSLVNYNECAKLFFQDYTDVQNVLKIFGPLSVISCGLFGFLIHKFHILVMIFILLTSSLFMYIFAVLKSKIFAYLSTVCYLIVTGCYTTQLYCYIQIMFPKHHFGKIAGTTSMISGLLSLLNIPIYNYFIVDYNRNDPHPFAYVVIALLVSAFPLLFLTYMREKKGNV
ncbi:transporter [Plasmodium gonderi]|uniref:Transporter n=1 Tax=Plasmodium gonderi TaxID=77519 RepID=A0A1Y1JD33_PLAGO|nr:transporter [Plasmodium gonderi]GAW79127.1 transporter [Plasmodium gonderi]